MRGKLIILEGADNVGKSTIARSLVTHINKGSLAAVYVRDPGSTKVGEMLRAILKDSSVEMSNMSQVLLFTAARLELFSRVINLHLAEGNIVILDRFVLSTIVYQGINGVRKRDITALHSIAFDHLLRGTHEIYGDLTIICGITDECRKERSKSNSKTDRFEQDEEFQSKVHDRYEKEYEVWKHLDCLMRLDTSGTIEETMSRLIPRIYRLTTTKE